jgi:hypothetical protein
MPKAPPRHVSPSPRYRYFARFIILISDHLFRLGDIESPLGWLGGV